MKRAGYPPNEHASIIVPYPWPDDAAGALIELRHQLTDALQSQYAAQLHRHHQPTEHRQGDLWDERDPPL